VRRLDDALALGRAAVRTYGLRGLARRSGYELERRTGRLTRRARPVVTGPLQLTLDLTTTGITSWYARHDDVARATAHRADALLAGRLALFGGAESSVSWPPAWNRHPATGLDLPVTTWTGLSDAGDLGDVRDPWELGRFCWSGPLLRAATAAGGPRYPAAFRDAVHSFRAACPPGMGVQWMNGQEIALRGIALLFGWGVLAPEERTDALRGDLDAILTSSVDRVMGTLRYAASQRNNHYVSEAAFLWTAAAVCPGLVDRERIQARAAAALREAVGDQFAADGSYAQHSVTYHRLALHALLWVANVARSSGLDPPVALDGVFDRSHRLLSNLVDLETGQVPNFGANDGSLLFQLTSRPIGDLRPLLVHLALEAGVAPSVVEGPWDEEAAWFGLDVGRPRADARPAMGVQGAYRVLRGPASFAFVHAGPHRHRPNHADQLHVDLWIGHANVARDLGTYRYTAPSPWANALAGDDVHNVPVPDGTTQARRRGRFFWLDWPSAEVLAAASEGDAEAFVAEVAVQGVRGGVARRLVARAGDRYVVADRCRPAAGTVRWNLPAGTAVELTDDGLVASGEDWWLRCRGGEGASGPLERSPSRPASGWESPTYAELGAVAVVTLRSDADGVVLSAFGPTSAAVPGDDLTGWWRAALQDPSASSLSAALLRLAG
jgi:hypothetical protein